MSRDTVFDRLATDYDAAFSARSPAQRLRARVRGKLLERLPACARILDIGCGTGDDALWFASKGHTVVATDVSRRMLGETRRKRDEARSDIASRISIAGFDAAVSGGVDEVTETGFDLVMSNFGGLNCVADLRPLFARIDELIRPDGVVALTIMGRFCAWETLGFLLRGNLRRAARRWRGRAEYRIAEQTQAVWYHTPASVGRMASPTFRVIDVYGIGVLLPTTEFFRVCEQRPRLMATLTAIEDRAGDYWPFDRIGDHYLILLEPDTAVARGRQ